MKKQGRGSASKLFSLLSLAAVLVPSTSSSQLLEVQKGLAFETPGFFGIPVAMAYDSRRNKLAVADRGKNGAYVFDLADGSWELLGSEQEISEPRGVAFDSRGCLYLTQAGQPSVLVFPPRSGLAQPFNLREFSLPSPFRPGRVYVDRENTVYIADMERPAIYLFDWQGVFVRSLTEKLHRPGGIFVEPSGEVLVADKGFDPVLLFSKSGVFLKRISRPGSPTEKQSYRAVGLAVDKRGWIYTLDANNSKIIAMDPTGARQIEYTPEMPFFPLDIVIDSYDNIYVLESGADRVRIFVRED